MSQHKVLLVDDVKLFLDITKSFLRNSAVEILTASDGEEALRVIREKRPDVVVMDINMPRMNGIDCCRSIKEDPVLASTPVILVSSSENENDITQARGVGCDGFLLKPLEAKVFLEKLRRYLPAVERREPRFVCCIPVTIGVGSLRANGIAVEMGHGGFYVATDYEAGVAAEIYVTFIVPGCESVKTVVKSRVAWVNGASSRIKKELPAGFGVEFVEVVGDGLAMVRNNELKIFIDKQLSGLKRDG